MIVCLILSLDRARQRTATEPKWEWNEIGQSSTKVPKWQPQSRPTHRCYWGTHTHTHTLTLTLTLTLSLSLSLSPLYFSLNTPINYMHTWDKFGKLFIILVIYIFFHSPFSNRASATKAMLVHLAAVEQSIWNLESLEALVRPLTRLTGAPWREEGVVCDCISTRARSRCSLW